VPWPSVPVVDAHLDRPVGHVGEADVEVDPVGADLEPGWIDRALPPLPQLAADLGHLRFQGQARLPVDVQAPVVSPPEQDGHAPAVGWVVEHLNLQALVVGVVGDLEVQHPVDGPHGSARCGKAIGRQPLAAAKPDDLVFPGPGGSNGIPQGARTPLSTHNTGDR
jgi:hypothetical protein